MVKSPVARRYGGQDAEQRQGERRERLMAAALDLFGTQGYAASSVKHVCDHAGLTQRYFYESFTDREQLLRAVADETVDLLRTAVADAVSAAGPDIGDRIRAGLTALVDVLTGDTRRARVILIETVGVSAALEARRREVMHEFVRYIASLVPGTAVPRHRLETGVMVLVGGVVEVMVDHLLGYRSMATGELVEVMSALFVGGYRALGVSRG
ncbi:TetR/AcrR family transcriptional regulator [Actinokineospora soli]|uniref:TetR/AcrR family transcriptional regulator n=1 Tax=Actinokineospora soli TaxID=1048753 RepID=A0ABW2TQF4_9PSEU